MNLIDRLVVSVVGDTAALKKSLADSKKQLSGFGAAVQKHSAAFMKTGAVMMGFAGAIGIAAIKVGKEFDKAYNKIRTGTGKTGKVLEGLKKDFRAVAKDVPNSLDEVSTAIADLNTRLGLTGKPLQAMAKQMLNLARITETDVNAVIRTSTRLFGDWDIAVEDQAETLDYLYKVSQSTGVGIDRLSDMVTTYGVQLRTVGFTLEESLALMGKWEKEGVSAEKMLGGLSMALGKFAKAQKEPEEAFRQLVKQIEEATTVGKAMELGVEALGTRAGPDFALAVREGRFAVEDFVAELAGSSETINQAAEDTMTLTEKFNLLKNQAKLAIEPLAKKLMDELSPAIEKVTDKLGDLDEETLDNIASYTLWAMKIIGVGGAFIFAMGAVAKFTVAIKTARTAMIALQASVAPLVAGYAALAAIGVSVSKGLSNVTLGFMDVSKGTRNWTDILTELVQVITLYPPYYGKMIEGLFGTKKATEESTEAIEEQIPVIKTAEEVIEEAKNQFIELGYTEEKATELAKENAKAMGYLEEETEDVSEVTEDLTEDVDNLRSSFNKLLGVLFDGINANNEYQESGWALAEVQEEVNKLVEEGKEGTEEHEKAVNKLDKQLQDHILAAYEVYTSTFTTREEQEKAKEEALKYGRQMVETGQWGEESFIKMAAQFDLSSDEIIRKGQELGLELDEATKDRTVVIGVDATGVPRVVQGVLDELGRIKDKTVKITVKQYYEALGAIKPHIGGYITPAGTLGFAKGGIAGSDGFSLPMLKAAQGLNIPSFDSGGILAMLDKYEVILNSPQQLNLAKLIFGLAEGKYGVKGSEDEMSRSIVLPITIELDGQVIYEKTSEYIYDQQQSKQRGLGEK